MIRRLLPFCALLSLIPVASQAQEAPPLDEELEGEGEDALDPGAPTQQVLDAHEPLRLAEPLTLPGVDPDSRASVRLALGTPDWQVAQVQVEHRLGSRIGLSAELGPIGDAGALRVGGRYALARSTTQRLVVTAGAAVELRVADYLTPALRPEVAVGWGAHERLEIQARLIGAVRKDGQLEAAAALATPLGQRLTASLEGSCLIDPAAAVDAQGEDLSLYQVFATVTPALRVHVTDELSMAAGAQIPVLHLYRSDFDGAAALSATWLW